MEKLMTVKGAFFAAAAVFFGNILLVVIGVYEKFTWIDIPMHALGGFLMGCLAWGIARYFVREVQFDDLKPLTRYVMSILYILGFVALIGILWEAYEFLADVLMQRHLPKMNQALAGQRQMGVRDLLGDMGMDLLGGAAAWWLGKDA